MFHIKERLSLATKAEKRWYGFGVVAMAAVLVVILHDQSMIRTCANDGTTCSKLSAASLMQAKNIQRHMSKEELKGVVVISKEAIR